MGTVLSLWDAAELDAAGDDGEVVPTFINLADASIKMVRLAEPDIGKSANRTPQIQSLPMNEGDGQQLQNVLSISTAANNRYLLHFNSLNSLTQWTAGIRLAMYEYATLQEAYTGSLVAGKGKTLNNIRQILERNKFKHEDWARVRFGAGTPWRRCWFVVSPPDEKEWEKAQKMAKKNKYSKPPILKGDIKFYESRKVGKRTRPIATITNAYSAYAIYPQSKPLIDQSTLVKIEGRITIHSMPESVTEGFVFVMPEVHAAISGFEMLLRFLFPVWDTFALYGRPTRLIADVLDQRGLMFAMPRDRRYGYLEILDVAGVIHSEGSSSWSERQWRSSLKELTSKRMLALGDEPRRISNRQSLPNGARNSVLRFDDGRNTPGANGSGRRAESAMAGNYQRENGAHRRVASEAANLSPYALSQNRLPLSTGAINERDASPPRPPPHSAFASSESVERLASRDSGTPSPGEVPPEVRAMATRSPPPEPVEPPVFAHAPGEKPRTRPNQAPDMRRAYSNLDEETRLQMADAVGRPGQLAPQAPPPYGQTANGYAGGYGQQRQHGQSNSRGTSPDSRSGGYRGNAPNANRLSTIPASPFVEQDSPILDRAGAVLPPPTVQEYPAPSPNMAASAAMAALAATPPYTKTPSPVHGNNPVEQGYNMYKANSNGSGTDLAKIGSRGSATNLQKVATGGSASSGDRPRLEQRQSVQRKPVGSSRLSGQPSSATTPPANAQWNPNRFSYESPLEREFATPVGQEPPYQTPYEHPPPQGYGFPQQGPPPPQHGQMPHRPAVQGAQQPWN